MHIFRGISSLSKSPLLPVVTIGNFDGVHLGHREIFRQVVDQARLLGGDAVAYTFRPHPQVALRPGADIQLLSTYDEKLEAFREAGLTVVVEEPFSREFSTTKPEQFFNDSLLRRLGARAVVVGYDFAFGKERSGHLEALSSFCERAGVTLTVVPPLRIGDEIVSSSRIRQHLLAGEIEAGNRLLGRDFSYRGVVVKGEGRGRKIGFPTANLQLENKLALPYGVYATESILGDERFLSVTNIGVRPTFYPAAEDGARELPALVETHILDMTRDLYGTMLEVRFAHRLREERKFPGVDALKAQIALDAAAARAILTRPRHPRT